MPTGGTGPDVSGRCKHCDKSIWGVDHSGLVQACDVSSDGFHEPAALSEDVFKICYDTWLMKHRSEVDVVREVYGLLPLAATEA